VNPESERAENRDVLTWDLVNSRFARPKCNRARTLSLSVRGSSPRRTLRSADGLGLCEHSAQGQAARVVNMLGGRLPTSRWGEGGCAQGRREGPLRGRPSITPAANLSKAYFGVAHAVFCFHDFEAVSLLVPPYSPLSRNRCFSKSASSSK
jgi:hypothetical protein